MGNWTLREEKARERPLPASRESRQAWEPVWMRGCGVPIWLKAASAICVHPFHALCLGWEGCKCGFQPCRHRGSQRGSALTLGSMQV